MQMHHDQVVVDAEIAGQLVRDQFPQWAELPVRPLTSAATVDAVFRVGDELTARFPMRLRGRAQQTLTIRFDDGEVTLAPGQLYVVPRGVHHQPVSQDGAGVPVLEPSSTVNTGDTPSALTADRRLA